MDETTLSVFLIALSAMVKVALISSVGVWMSLYPKDYPLLQPPLMKSISAIISAVFIPALVVHSLGSSVTLELLQRFGVLVFLCLLIILISYVSTYAFKWLHEDDPKLFTAVLVAVGSPNAISMPLLVMKTICENSTVNADYDDDPQVCFNEASSMLFIYQIGWHLVFWSVGFPLLKSLDDDENIDGNQNEIIEPIKESIKGSPDESSVIGSSSSSSSSNSSGSGSVETKANRKGNWKDQILNNLILSPCMIAIYVGIGIGIIPYLQEWFFEDMTVLRPLGSAMATLGEPVVCMNTLIMSASLAQVYIRIKKQREVDGCASSIEENTLIEESKCETGKGEEGRSITNSDGTSYSIGGESIGSSKGGEKCQIINVASTTPELDNDQMGVENEVKESCGWFTSASSSTYSSSSSEDIDGAELTGTEPCIDMAAVQPTEVIVLPKFRTIGVMILCRLILPSIIMIAVMELCVQVNLVPKEERLMRLLIVIEAASPSAQLIIVSLNQVGGMQIASQVSYMYVYQYTISIFTITMFTTLGMRMIYV